MTINELEPPINVSLSGGYQPPTKIESTCSKVLKSWHECDLDNVASINEMKHKVMRKQWMKTDSGMRDNLSKRGQIVNQIIVIFSAEHDVSMEKAATKLDRIRVS